MECTTCNNCTPFGSVALTLTRNCNLRCPFCYLTAKTHEPDPNEVQRNLDAFNWVIEQYRGNFRNGIQGDMPGPDILFFGGEPVCAWPSIKAIIKAAERSDVKGITFCLVSNMSILTPKKIDWCLNHNIRISPSIDGCREMQDYSRLTPDGCSVADAVYRNSSYFRARCPMSACRSTIMPETAKWCFKSIRFLCEELGFQTANQIMAGGVDWPPDALEEVKSQHRMITDWWLENMRRGQCYGLMYLEHFLKSIWNPVRKHYGCSAATTHIGIDTNGDIVPCERFCNPDIPPEFKLGNIYEGGITNRGMVALLKGFNPATYHKERCSTCTAVNACNGFCIYEIMQERHGMFEPTPVMCEMTKFYHAEAMRAHSIMLAEDNERYLELYGPRANSGD